MSDLAARHPLATQRGGQLFCDLVAALCTGNAEECPACEKWAVRVPLDDRGLRAYECECGATWCKRGETAWLKRRLLKDTRGGT